MPNSPCSEEQVDLDLIPRTLQEILNRVQDLYRSWNVDLPERKFWAVGPVEPETCQVSVALVDLNREQDEPNCDSTLRATVEVTLVRCAPVENRTLVRARASGSPLTVEQIEKKGKELAIDMTLLFQNACYFNISEGISFDAQIAAGSLEGGMQAVVLTLNLAL